MMRVFRRLLRLRTSLKLIFVVILSIPAILLWKSVVLYTYTQHSTSASKSLFIAIGGGITSNRIDAVNKSNIGTKFLFFTTLVPSFCQTIHQSTGSELSFAYRFYLAYDSNDVVFSQSSLRDAFVDVFSSLTKHICPGDVEVGLQLVHCSHQGRPAWAQNDAMIEAYLDGAEYFYRINDDTVFVTPNWAEAFTSILSRYTPQNVGVVGPAHDTGNLAILTYDFVHRSHIEVFGFYYPRAFTDWFADDWITDVYAPQHVSKLLSVKVKHQSVLGRRYFYDAAKRNILFTQLNFHRQVLARLVIPQLFGCLYFVAIFCYEPTLCS
jgi:hypothetical protein